jgi:GTP-binding protein
MTLDIAIVGRPNVGKSTLFNRLAGRRLALVAKEPGLTRDRRVAEAEIGDLSVRLIDTAGLEEADDDSVVARMRAQSEAAIADADIVLFVIDARSGVVPADEVFAELVRVSSKPVVLVANKCESRAGEAGFYDAYRLGLGDPVAISAEHGQGIGELFEAITAASDAAPGEPEDEHQPVDRPMRVAIIGRPNAGKSTLVNALLGEERVITGPEAGITRDAIAIDWQWRDQAIELYDTAGLRRKARVKPGSEQLSVDDALKAIRFAEVVILIADADHPFEKQDLQIADLAAQEGRAIVIAVNKWDLVADKKASRLELGREVERLLPQISGVPLIPVSAIRRNGLEPLMDAVLEVYRLWNKRISTSALNNWLRDAEARHPPPAVSGRRIKLRYMTQPHARPPTFVLFCSRPQALSEAYKRYLMNGLRDDFGLKGVPLRINTRQGRNPYAAKS